MDAAWIWFFVAGMAIGTWATFIVEWTVSRLIRCANTARRTRQRNESASTLPPAYSTALIAGRNGYAVITLDTAERRPRIVCAVGTDVYRADADQTAALVRNWAESLHLTA